MLDGSHSRWNVPGMTGPVAAYSLPATLGELTITLSSEVQNNQVFAPNVLVLDEHLRPGRLVSEPLVYLSATRRNGR